MEVTLECEGVPDLAISVDSGARCPMLAWSITITWLASKFICCSVLEVAGVDVKVGRVQLAQPRKGDVPGLPHARVFIPEQEATSS
jgi:hypothetical protein